MERALDHNNLTLALGELPDVPTPEELQQLLADAELALFAARADVPDTLVRAGWYLHAIASQAGDGQVALPADSRTREQLEWLADSVVEAGGEATVWLAQPGSAAQERMIAARMQADVGAEYRKLMQEAKQAQTTPVGARKRTLGRLRRELRRVRRRDYFPAPEREPATAAVDALAASVEQVPA